MISEYLPHNLYRGTIVYWNPERRFAFISIDGNDPHDKDKNVFAHFDRLNYVYYNWTNAILRHSALDVDGRIENGPEKGSKVICFIVRNGSRYQTDWFALAVNWDRADELRRTTPYLRVQRRCGWDVAAKPWMTVGQDVPTLLQTIQTPTMNGTFSIHGDDRSKAICYWVEVNEQGRWIPVDMRTMNLEAYTAYYPGLVLLPEVEADKETVDVVS